MARSPESASKDAYEKGADPLGRTGVEMETLTAVQLGLLTVYGKRPPMPP
jgi:hypothetical protein